MRSLTSLCLSLLTCIMGIAVYLTSRGSHQEGTSLYKQSVWSVWRGARCSAYPPFWVAQGILESGFSPSWCRHSQFAPTVPNSVQNICFYIKGHIDHSRRNDIFQFTKSGRGFFFLIYLLSRPNQIWEFGNFCFSIIKRHQVVQRTSNCPPVSFLCRR